jgi:hypothetical protein
MFYVNLIYLSRFQVLPGNARRRLCLVTKMGSRGFQQQRHWAIILNQNLHHRTELSRFDL